MGWASTPYTHVTGVQLDLHMGPLTTEAGAVSDPAACLLIPFPKWLELCLGSIREDRLSPTAT